MNRLVKYLFYCLPLLLISCGAPTTISIAKDLPLADKKYESMELTPAIEIHGNDSIANAIRYGEGVSKVYFFDGWDYVVSNDQCGVHFQLTLQRESDQKLAIFDVVGDRDNNAIMRWLGYLLGGNCATVFYIAQLNSRYLAFLTSEEGYVFFDRKEGKFLNYVLRTRNFFDSKSYIAPDGTVIVHDYRSYGAAEPSDVESVHVVKYAGLDLTAPFESRDLIEINRYRTPKSQLWFR